MFLQFSQTNFRFLTREVWWDVFIVFPLVLPSSEKVWFPKVTKSKMDLYQVLWLALIFQKKIGILAGLFTLLLLLKVRLGKGLGATKHKRNKVTKTMGYLVQSESLKRVVSPSCSQTRLKPLGPSPIVRTVPVHQQLAEMNLQKTLKQNAVKSDNRLLSQKGTLLWNVYFLFQTSETCKKRRNSVRRKPTKLEKSTKNNLGPSHKVS